LNFPSNHPLNITRMANSVLASADCVLALDARNLYAAISREDPKTGRNEYITPRDCFIAEIGYRDLDPSIWAEEFYQVVPVDLQITASTAVALPPLIERVKQRVGSNPAAQAVVKERSQKIGDLHRTTRQRWAEDARKDWDAVPMTSSRLALEIWEAIKNEDWTLTVNPLWGVANRLWDFDKPDRFPGNLGGTATGATIGLSLGIALAYKGTGKLVVDIQNDGDLMFDASALWVAANQRLPMLVVMFNNRSYYNDWGHQIHVAKERGRPVENAWVGQTISDPDPDFAMLARSFGWYAEGPIMDPKDLGPALARAIAQVKAGKPALVDAVAQAR
jgi:acetolactate synthase-1/2/3 large subunit